MLSIKLLLLYSIKATAKKNRKLKKDWVHASLLLLLAFQPYESPIWNSPQNHVISWVTEFDYASSGKPTSSQQQSADKQRASPPLKRLNRKPLVRISATKVRTTATEFVGVCASVCVGVCEQTLALALAAVVGQTKACSARKLKRNGEQQLKAKIKQMKSWKNLWKKT